MISFFGLSKILSKKDLWINEKEHSAVIKKVKLASSCNLPKQIIETVFPLGWKSSETIIAKYEFSKKIQNMYPIPILPELPLEDISEQEMRTYIETLDTALQKQFDGCIELLYGVKCTDENFLEIKQIVSKKFLKVTMQEVSIVIWVITAIFLTMLGLLSLIMTKTIISDNIILLFVLPFVVFLVLFGIYGFVRISYFKINKDIYPKL